MTHEIRNRIIRDATTEEKQAHSAIRAEVEKELPALKDWARVAAARNCDRIAVGTVFTSRETDVVQAIDDYAAAHCLENRGAVVREALARLLGVEISQQ